MIREPRAEHVADMSEHFAAVASRYRQVRTTDLAPIRYIQNRLAAVASPRGADIGCGDGRYSQLLFRYLPGLHLTCIDASSQMLTELSGYLTKHGIRNFDTVRSDERDMDLEDDSLEFICTFNAIHHFDVAIFLDRVRRALTVGGRLFIYTRMPEHNAESIWGRYFPGFTEKETRLLALSTMKDRIAAAGGLRLVAVERYRYPREASLDRLLEQARTRHYSTFSLYEPSELSDAISKFEHSVRQDFDDAGSIAWDDQNVLYEVARADG